jgi:hypothetical protein
MRLQFAPRLSVKVLQRPQTWVVGVSLDPNLAAIEEKMGFGFADRQIF